MWREPAVIVPGAFLAAVAVGVAGFADAQRLAWEWEAKKSGMVTPGKSGFRRLLPARRPLSTRTGKCRLLYVCFRALRAQPVKQARDTVSLDDGGEFGPVGDKQA